MDSSVYNGNLMQLSKIFCFQEPCLRSLNANTLVCNRKLKIGLDYVQLTQVPESGPMLWLPHAVGKS